MTWKELHLQEAQRCRETAEVQREIAGRTWPFDQKLAGFIHHRALINECRATEETRLAQEAGGAV